jgi:hypothetical protein
MLVYKLPYYYNYLIQSRINQLFLNIIIYLSLVFEIMELLKKKSFYISLIS